MSNDPFSFLLPFPNPTFSSTMTTSTSILSSSTSSDSVAAPTLSPPPVPFFRTPYNYSIDFVSFSTGHVCEDPSLTRQSDSEDADINVIVGRFLKTGLLPENVRVPEYGDFSQVSDYKTSLDLVRKAEAAFAEYPADIRAKYAHDVGVFLDAAYAGEVPGVVLDDKTQPKAAEAPSGASPVTDGKAV